MPGKDKEVQLSTEITDLKQKLEMAFQKRKSFKHPEVMAISTLLDEKIVEYMKIKKLNRNVNVENLE